MRGIDVISLKQNGRRHPNCYAVIVPGHTMVIANGKMLYVKRSENGRTQRYVDVQYPSWEIATHRMLMEIDNDCASPASLNDAVATRAIRAVELNP